MRKSEIEKEVAGITKGERFVNDDQLDKLGEVANVYLENCGISGTGKGTLYTLYFLNEKGNKTDEEITEVVLLD